MTQEKNRIGHQDLARQIPDGLPALRQQMAGSGCLLYRSIRHELMKAVL